MTPNLRLRLCVAMVVMSTMYGLVVVQDPQVAAAIAVGYVALLLTLFTLVHFWKKS